jgi:hypothetical protein
VLLKQNATTAEIDEAKRLSELSPTALFLEQFELKKKALEEDKALKVKRAEDLQIQKDAELVIINTFTDKQTLLDETYASNKAKIEALITDNLVQEVSKRETALESLRLKAEARARAMRKA